MTYMAKTPSPRVKKTVSSKDLRIYYQSIYNHPAGHRYDFHGDQCLVGEAWTRRSDDLYHHRRSRSNLWWHTLCPRTAE